MSRKFKNGNVFDSVYIEKHAMHACPWTGRAHSTMRRASRELKYLICPKCGTDLDLDNTI